MDSHKNFAVSAIAGAPSPATSGTSTTVTTGHGTRFPATPFNAVIWPTATAPTPANAEVVRVTGIAGDVFTIVRAQESSVARTVIVGDQIAAAFTAKALTDIEAMILTPLGQYIVDGISYAQTRAGIQEAVDDVEAAGGGVVLIPPDTSITFDTTPVLLPSNVTLKGSGPTSILKAPNSAGSVNLIGIAGASSSLTTLAGNEAEGDRTVVLTAGGVAALGLAAGDYIYLYDSASDRNQTFKVTGISTETLTLSEPLALAFPSATTDVGRFSTVIENVHVIDLAFDGNGNSGTTRGIYAEYAAEISFERLSFIDFPESALKTLEVYAVRIIDVDIVESGSASESDLFLAYSSMIQIADVRSIRATGFGPQLAACTWGQVSNLLVSKADGRAYKLRGTCYVNHSNVTVLNATTTGVSVTQQSARNVFTGTIAQANGAAGIWCEGAGDSFNRFIGGISKFNTTRDVEFGASATSNVILYVEYTGILDSGTTTVKVP